jgi:phosphotriesterase-related protein
VTPAGTTDEGEGLVRTVLGDVGPDALGQTSMHEHLLLDCRVFYTTRAPGDEVFRDQPVSQETLPTVRWNGFSFLDNLVLDSVDTAVGELKAFGLAGGSTVLDLTSRGLGTRPEALREISRMSGVNIVLGAGYYVHATHDADT